MRTNVLLLLAFLYSRSAHAYIDPGTGSIILQAILGGVGGVYVFIKLYWKKHFTKNKNEVQPVMVEQSEPRKKASNE